MVVYDSLTIFTLVRDLYEYLYRIPKLGQVHTISVGLPE